MITIKKKKNLNSIRLLTRGELLPILSHASALEGAGHFEIDDTKKAISHDVDTTSTDKMFFYHIKTLFPCWL